MSGVRMNPADRPLEDLVAEEIVSRIATALDAYLDAYEQRRPVAPTEETKNMRDGTPYEEYVIQELRDWIVHRLSPLEPSDQARVDMADAVLRRRAQSASGENT